MFRCHHGAMQLTYRRSKVEERKINSEKETKIVKNKTRKTRCFFLFSQISFSNSVLIFSSIQCQCYIPDLIKASLYIAFLSTTAQPRWNMNIFYFSWKFLSPFSCSHSEQRWYSSRCAVGFKVKWHFPFYFYTFLIGHLFLFTHLKYIFNIVNIQCHIWINFNRARWEKRVEDFFDYVADKKVNTDSLALLFSLQKKKWNLTEMQCSRWSTWNVVFC